MHQHFGQREEGAVPEGSILSVSQDLPEPSEPCVKGHHHSVLAGYDRRPLDCKFPQIFSAYAKLHCHVLGGSLARRNLPRLRLKAQGKCLGTIPLPLEPLRRLHHQHVIENSRQARMLGTRANAQVRPQLLLAVA
jgi:hypothetical protein